MRKFHLRKSERGFSLAELAIMLGMTTVLAAVSIPMLSSAMQGMQLSADAKSIATTLTYARVSAASQLTRYRMNLNTGTNQWTMSRWNRASNAYEVQQSTNGLSAGVSNSGIAFKASSGTAPEGFPTTSSTAVTFNSRGIPMEGAGIIYLSGRKADFAISISAAGQVQLWRNQNGQWSKK